MHDHPWWETIAAAVTVTDAEGIIVAMNKASMATFAADGGGDLIGRSVFDCHPEPALSRTRDLYRDREPNHYTIEKDGRRKIIHQLPLLKGGVFGGFVEISIPIPEPLPHFKRDQVG